MQGLYRSGYAVVVGVGGDLPPTIRDAAAVANLLTAADRCAYPPQQVQLLTGEKASRAGVLAALNMLARQCAQDPEATAIFYFSGHGAQQPDYYLLPAGYNVANLAETAIGEVEFTKHLRAIRARRLIVLLDCCYAGGLGQAKDGLTPAPLPPQFLDVLGGGAGRVIIASSRKDETSLIFANQPNSVFTQTLLEGLAGYGAFERDGYARVLDVALYVGRMVPNRTRDRQHPIIKVSDLKDNFALAYYAGGDHTPKQLHGASALPAVPTVDGTHLQRRLANRREALLLIEERMSEYIVYEDIPLQLVKNKRRTEEEIAKLERELGLAP